MSVDVEKLKSFLLRITSIDAEIKLLNDEKAFVYDEARWAGLSVKAIREIVAYKAARRGEAIDISALYDAFARSMDMSQQEATGIVEPKEGWVYFALFPKINRLKIGFSTVPRQRLLHLNRAVGETHDLLAILPGCRRLEMRCLMAFAGWRLQGEWFSYTPECAAHLSEFLTQFNVQVRSAA